MISTRPCSPVRVFLALAVAVAFLWSMDLASSDTIWAQMPWSHHGPVQQFPPPGEKVYGSHWKQLNLGTLTADKVKTLYFRVEPVTQPLSLVEHLDVGLSNASTSKDPEIDRPDEANVPSMAHLKAYRDAGHPDASALLFGVATTLGRLNDSLADFAHWAGGTNCTIVALVIPSPGSDLEQWQEMTLVHPLLERARTLGVDLVVHSSSQGWHEAYVSLLRVLYDARQPGRTEWVILIDDDTFFPSMSRLLRMLARYDPQEPHYIGGVSEDSTAEQSFGTIAFGGAGVFLSLPLVEQLQPHVDECTLLPHQGGDGKVASCIRRFTTTELSVEPGLHQVDLLGDQSGFYEALRELPASVHHWKSWGHLDMTLIGVVGSFTGPESRFQKYHLPDGWWMTHGFSIVRYGDEKVDQQHRRGVLEATFRSAFGSPIDEKHFPSLAPLGPKDEKKVSYRLEAVGMSETESGTDDLMSLYYVRRRGTVAIDLVRVVCVRQKGLEL